MTTPEESRKTPVPAPTLKQRLAEALFGMMAGLFVGGIVGAIVLALIGALFVQGIFLVITAGMVGALFGGIYGATYGMLHGAFVGPLREVLSSSTEHRPKFAGSKMVLHAVCLGTIAVLAASLWFTQAESLPISEDVQSMFAEWRGQGEKPISFSVPARDIPAVLGALNSATRDWSPAKWVGTGQLKIICRNGRKITVDLYRTREKSGAFSVHTDGRPRNSSWISSYFRGGSDTAIERTIKSAYQDSKLE